MRHLLNTLFVTSEDIYLSLDNENVVINRNGTAIKKLVDCIINLNKK